MPADNLTPTWNPDVTPDIVANNFTLVAKTIPAKDTTCVARCKHCHLGFASDTAKLSELVQHMTSRHPGALRSYGQAMADALLLG